MAVLEMNFPGFHVVKKKYFIENFWVIFLTLNDKFKKLKSNKNSTTCLRKPKSTAFLYLVTDQDLGVTVKSDLNVILALKLSQESELHFQVPLKGVSHRQSGSWCKVSEPDGQKKLNC